MFSCAVGKEEHCKQISLVCVGSAPRVWASGFASTHGVCAFPVCTAQASGCSAGELSNAGPGLRALPRSTRSGSGSWGLHKGTDSVGSAFCAIHRSEQLRQPGAWRVHSPIWAVHLITSPVPAPWFPWCTARAPSQICLVSPLGADL